MDPLVVSKDDAFQWINEGTEVVSGARMCGHEALGLAQHVWPRVVICAATSSSAVCWACLASTEGGGRGVKP